MDFRSYDALRLFAIVARHRSFTAAGDELNLTKGAVSYQIKQLERELGFKLFIRQYGGITLTEKGEKLWHAAQLAFHNLEQQITTLRESEPEFITVGTSTYFASRWLSPRLMTFITRYPHIRLRLQPVVGFGDLREENLDLMIRWGKADWSDVKTELLFRCPAVPTGGPAIATRIKEVGLAAALPDLTLLHDRDGSQAWQDWFEVAGLVYHPRQASLIIPDPNVRVQAVIDGQGLALNDALIAPKMEAGQLFQISPVKLEEYGYYLCYSRGALDKPALQAFRDWIVGQVKGED